VLSVSQSDSQSVCIQRVGCMAAALLLQGSEQQGVMWSTSVPQECHITVNWAGTVARYWIFPDSICMRGRHDESMKTMVHSFVMTRVDFCNTVFAGAPRSVTDKLQRVINAAARLVSGTRKYDHGLSHLLHIDLHWLDVADRVKFKLGLTVQRCLITRHHTTLLIAVRSSPTSPVGGGYVQLIVANWMYHDTTAAARSFSVAGPTVWNLLPDDLRDQGCIESTFKQSLKTYLLAQH